MPLPRTRDEWVAEAARYTAKGGRVQVGEVCASCLGLRPEYERPAFPPFGDFRLRWCVCQPPVNARELYDSLQVDGDIRSNWDVERAD